MDMECKSGEMGRGTKVAGSAIWQTAMAGLNQQMATYTKECGLTTRHMAKVNLFDRMVASMMGNGVTTSSMVKGLRLGQMAPISKEITIKVFEKAWALCISTMEVSTKAIL